MIKRSIIVLILLITATAAPAQKNYTILELPKNEPFIINVASTFMALLSCPQFLLAAAMEELTRVEQQLSHAQARLAAQEIDDDCVISSLNKLHLELHKELLKKQKKLWYCIADLEAAITRQEAEKNDESVTFECWSPIAVWKTIVAACTLSDSRVCTLHNEFINLLQTLTDIEEELAPRILPGELLFIGKTDQDPSKHDMLKERIRLRKQIMQIKEQLDTTIKLYPSCVIGA